jgi:hypothetical protein
MKFQTAEEPFVFAANLDGGDVDRYATLGACLGAFSASLGVSRL